MGNNNPKPHTLKVGDTVTYDVAHSRHHSGAWLTKEFTDTVTRVEKHEDPNESSYFYFYTNRFPTRFNSYSITQVNGKEVTGNIDSHSIKRVNGKEVKDSIRGLRPDPRARRHVPRLGPPRAVATPAPAVPAPAPAVPAPAPAGVPKAGEMLWPDTSMRL